MNAHTQTPSLSLLNGIAMGDMTVSAAAPLEGISIPVGVLRALTLSGSSDRALPAWIDCASGRLSSAAPHAPVTVGDVMVAANDLAAALGGRIVDFSLHADGGAKVYAFGVSFECDGEVCLGTVGFSPIADGTVSVFAATCGADVAAAHGSVRPSVSRHDRAAA